MNKNIAKSLGILAPDHINATNLRLNKRGNIQYSTDWGLTWQNIWDSGKWINLFAAPFDDLDGDGESDDVLSALESIEKRVSTMEQDGTKQEIANLKNDIQQIRSQIADHVASISPITDEQIDEIVKKYKFEF